jgi:subtilisin family serine protease
MALPQAHTIATGQGQRVAVLDTGIDATHPALAGRLVPGWDFVDDDADPAEVGTAGVGGFGHGTHVAGLVALAAPGAQIMPLRVLNAAGEGNIWVLAEAMLHAVDPDRVPTTPDGARVINLSLGTTQRTEILDLVTRLVECTDDDDDDNEVPLDDPGYNDDKERCNVLGSAVVVAAAGNSGSSTEQQYPAAEDTPGRIAVAASTAAGRLARLSNSGPWVDVAAPGEGITSTVPGGGYGVWSGTSMATPLVAGVAAMLFERNPDRKPEDVTKRLRERATALCGTPLRQVNADGAVRDIELPGPSCGRRGGP